MTDKAIDGESQAVDAVATSSTATIQVKGVTKRFGARIAVDNLSFEVNRGEIVGFLGPNGSGKTTTMRMLTSFYTPDAGSISVDGADTQQDDIKTRSSIGYLPENNPLYEDMLVSEYLSFVAELRGLSGATRRENLDSTVEETGIQEVFYRPIHELSKGFHQRVGLAQAILHRPPVLVLDEPTEGLDPNQRISMRDLIRHLGSDRTVLISTHVMQEVESTCQRALVISRGKLVADSTVEDLIQQAMGLRSIHLEVEGSQIEAGLATISEIDRVEPAGSNGDRKSFTISVSGASEPRGDIFRLAKKRNWVIWELHQEQPRLEDVFHALTAEQVTDADGSK